MSENTESTEKVTGKQVITELEEFLQDLGKYLFQIGKTVYVKVKVALSDKNKQSDGDEKTEKAITKAE